MRLSTSVRYTTGLAPLNSRRDERVQTGEALSGVLVADQEKHAATERDAGRLRADPVRKNRVERNTMRRTSTAAASRLLGVRPCSGSGRMPKCVYLLRSQHLFWARRAATPRTQIRVMKMPAARPVRPRHRRRRYSPAERSTRTSLSRATMATRRRMFRRPRPDRSTWPRGPTELLIHCRPNAISASSATIWGFTCGPMFPRRVCILRHGMMR